MVNLEENSCVACRKICLMPNFVSVFELLPFSKMTIAKRISRIASPLPLKLESEIVCIKCYSLVRNIERCEENLWIVTQELLYQICFGMHSIFTDEPQNTDYTNTELLMEEESSDSDESNISSSSCEDYGALYRFDDLDTDFPENLLSSKTMDFVCSRGASPTEISVKSENGSFKGISSSDIVKSSNQDTKNPHLQFTNSEKSFTDPIKCYSSGLNTDYAQNFQKLISRLENVSGTLHLSHCDINYEIFFLQF